MYSVTPQHCDFMAFLIWLNIYIYICTQAVFSLKSADFGGLSQLSVSKIGNFQLPTSASLTIFPSITSRHDNEEETNIKAANRRGEGTKNAGRLSDIKHRPSWLSTIKCFFLFIISLFALKLFRTPKHLSAPLSGLFCLYSHADAVCSYALHRQLSLLSYIQAGALALL